VDGAIQSRPGHGRSGLAAILRRRTLVMLGLGFSSGLPYLLIFDTLSAWLRDSGLTLTKISAFVLVTYVYAFKFVWAPLVDQLSIPLLGRWLGRRRAWMLLAQLVAAATLFVLSTVEPARSLAVVAITAVIVGLASATQDIVIDAWRIEVAEADAQGVMAAAYQWGYRLAMIASGVIPLVLAERQGWHVAYAVMAALMAVGIAAALFAPIPPVEAAGLAGRTAQPAIGLLGSLRRAVVDPFADFFRRFGGAGALILALVCFYRLSDFSLTVMNPFYLDLGFSKTEIAEVRKVFGVVMTLVGVAGGGWAIARFGLRRCLPVGAIISPLTHLVYAWLTTQGPSPSGLMGAIALDNLAEGFAGTCLIAYMSSLTTRGSTATQYALLSSLYALPGKTLGANSGRIIEGLARLAAPGHPLAGWTALFSRLPARSFASGAAKIGVPSTALAAGYAGFFVYAFMLGGIGIVLSLLVAWRQPGARPVPPAEPA
jgi:MFS transporter, PAT family, beta-lactamase induction signal transducer AmpG